MLSRVYDFWDYEFRRNNANFEGNRNVAEILRRAILKICFPRYFRKIRIRRILFREKYRNVWNHSRYFSFLRIFLLSTSILQLSILHISLSVNRIIFPRVSIFLYHLLRVEVTLEYFMFFLVSSFFTWKMCIFLSFNFLHVPQHLIY